MNTDPIILAAKLINMRDGMRRLLGAGYDKQVTDARRVQRSVSEREKIPLAEAAISIGRKMDAAGVDPSLIFAAFLDECEHIGFPPGETR